MDADDICRRTRFERQLAYLNQHPECVAVGSAVTLIDPEGMPIRDVANELTHAEIDAAHLSGTNESRICHPSVMMRKEAVVRVGKYREENLFAEDLDLFLRLAEDAGELANLPEVLLEYRHQVTSICYANYAKQRQVAKQAVEIARARRGISNSMPLTEPDTKSELSGDVHRKWAWWALFGGNLRTARKHAVKAVLQEPWNIENLRALACAIRGY